MNVVEIRTVDLIPYENNPRINDGAVEAVANSIKDFGFRNPIIVNSDNVVIAGHTRLKAALRLGLDTVPCIIADGLTQEQARAFRLADNKVAEASTWDEALMWEELNEINDEYDMTAYGFEPDIPPDLFGEEFSLPSGDKESLSQMSITMAKEQKELAEYVISLISEEITPDPRNDDTNGNAIAEVCRQWEELRTYR